MIDHDAFLGDTARTFRLEGTHVLELEQLTGKGIGTLCANVFAGRFGSNEKLRESIRLGLIGGGCESKEAVALLETYVDPRPLPKATRLPSPFSTPNSPAPLLPTKGAKMTLTTKSLEFKAALDVSDDGAIEGIAWPFAHPDRTGDLVAQGAFGKPQLPLPNAGISRRERPRWASIPSKKPKPVWWLKVACSSQR